MSGVGEHLQRLQVHDAWAQREVVAALREKPVAEGVRLLAHVVAVEWLWLERLGWAARGLPVWPALDLEACAAELGPLDAVWRQRLPLLDDDELGRPVSYTNSRGESFESTVADILTHGTLHSAHHRGQISAAIRAQGGVPPVVDFIHAARQGCLD